MQYWCFVCDLLGAVAGEEADDEDEAAEGGQRHGVARHVDHLAVLVEAPDARAHQQTPHQRAHRCNDKAHGRYR